MTDQPEHSQETPPRPRRRELSAHAAVVALLVGLLAAIAVPGSRAGIGLALAALATVAAAFDAARGRDRWRSAYLLMAGVLALTPLVRDAGWLTVFALLAATLLCAVALVEGTSWRGLLAGPRTVAQRLPGAPIAVVRATAVATPMPAAESTYGALRGATIGGSLVVVFGTLFASADGAFAELIGSVTPRASLFGDLPLRLTVATLAAGLAGGLALSTGSTPKFEALPARRTLAPLEWSVALASLVILFATFVGVQFVVLFGGDAHVLETANLTYSEYAQEGFGQLLTAAALVLAVVAGARRWARTETSDERLLLRALLGALCALTLIVLVAALHRLDLYVDAFGATRARVVAAATCAWLGGLLGLVLAMLLSDRAHWLPRAAVALTGAAAIAFTLANPDAWIASRNVDRYEAEERFDIAYASALSADAVPALASLPPEIANEALGAQRVRLERDDGPFGLNLSRGRARRALDDLP